MLPIPNLDDKTFAQLIEDAKKQIPRYAPDWTDYNVHDPGIMLLELFSWLAEGQRYYLDQVRDEHIRKYLKLLGTTPAPPKPARTEVTFSLKKKVNFNRAAEPDLPLFIPAGTLLTGGDLVFETEADLHVVDTALIRIVTLAGSSLMDQTESAGHEGLTFKAFGDRAEAGSSLYLGFNQMIPAGTPFPLSFRLFEDYPVLHALEEQGFPVTPPAKLSWEFLTEDSEWAPLVQLKDETCMLTRSGTVWIHAPEGAGVARLFPIIQEACCWFRCTIVEPGYELVPRIDSILLHTVPARQSVRTVQQLLGRSNGLSRQSFELQHAPLVIREPAPMLEVLESGDAAWVEWEQVADLDASVPDDRHYVLDRESRCIRFGDGLHGKVPPASPLPASIRYTYYTTSGSQGNVSAGTVQQLVLTESTLPLAERLKVDQLSAASGGTDLESMDAAVVRAVRELKQLTRAVTDNDYELLACRTPGVRVARAKAMSSERNAVTVVVVPYSDRPNTEPSSGFLDTVSRYLDRHRLVTTKVSVIAPQYVKAQVNALVTVKSGYHGAAIVEVITETLSSYLNPLTGGPGGAGWPFGRTVYLSDIYALIDRVEGVERVERVQLFNTSGAGRIDEQGNLVIAANALIYAEGHQIELEQSWTGRTAQEGAWYARIRPQ